MASGKRAYERRWVGTSEILRDTFDDLGPVLTVEETAAELRALACGDREEDGERAAAERAILREVPMPIASESLVELGHEDALFILQREIEAHEAALPKAGGNAFPAAALAFRAEAALRLSRNATFAADVLVRLIDRPGARGAALQAIAGAVDAGVTTEAMDLLEMSIARFLDGDARDFIDALPALYQWWPARTLARARRVLRRGTPLERADTSIALVHVAPEPWPALALVLRWLRREALLRPRAQAAARMGRLVVLRLRREICRDALASESPSLRKEGVRLLPTLPRDAREQLARAALESEPDAILRELLVQRVDD